MKNALKYEKTLIFILFWKYLPAGHIQLKSKSKYLLLIV